MWNVRRVSWLLVLALIVTPMLLPQLGSASLTAAMAAEIAYGGDSICGEGAAVACPCLCVVQAVLPRQEPPATAIAAARALLPATRTLRSVSRLPEHHPPKA